ncbi:PEP-CTERM sorting domain-containing protein [Intestinicryptomonas porci]|uniref:PEP-CTERM sorting domain-containing protein n=1 Tax=Intestinicryptomonas porci TaxID=2926320 RepID=A0ABU4WF72_9BACT|nr:PEP-CTERM sorting domain-containing protein [Opitutales bacterium CLA-KB-P66]
MKKISAIFISIILTMPLFAAWNASTMSGNWSDSGIWNQGTVPSTSDDGVNIGAGTVVTIDSAVDPVKSIFVKPNASIVFMEGASVTSAGLTLDGTGTNLTFLGGSYVTSSRINQKQNGCGDYIFGGIDEFGKFKAAVAKSINSTNRLQMMSGTTATYNVAASNLITQKSSGLDDNAIFYTTGEFQQMQGEFVLDFSNILLQDLFDAGIEGGTYYVALVSFGVTYKTLGGSEFAPTLSDNSVFGDFVSFEGFEWANDSKNNNTLYAVLNINPSVPEPSTYAAIFGALALAFVAYKRRK